MTIALVLGVNDGLVLAADSAATILTKNAADELIPNIYENANKVFNLCKGIPIGAVVWDSGSIRSASMETLAKDFRRRLNGDEPNHAGLVISPRAVLPVAYTVKDVAGWFHDFLYHENYLPATIGCRWEKSHRTAYSSPDSLRAYPRRRHTRLSSTKLVILPA